MSITNKNLLALLLGLALIASLGAFSAPHSFAQDSGETVVESSETPPPPPPPPPPSSEPEQTVETLDSNPCESSCDSTPCESTCGSNDDVTPPTDGENGEDAPNAGEDPAPESGEGTDGEPSEVPAEITTGNAGASSDAENEINTNELDATGSDLTASTTNDALIEQNSTSTAETGTNTASGGGGGNALIDTGNAAAVANVVNVANTNIINSNGFLLFLNTIFGQFFDLRVDFNLMSAQSGCTLTSCPNGGVDLNVTVENDVTITNTIVVRSSTGENSASASGNGDATILTGDAYAAANVLNLANSNIIDSNYLLITLNNFGDLAGDIILPGADFFSQLFSSLTNSAPSGSVTVNANNDATVDNNIDVGAETGANTAGVSGDGSGTILTGDAGASATSLNEVNTNLFGGSSVVLLFRIFGDWSGEIQGLPEGISWMETPYGIQLVSDDSLSALTASGGNIDDLTVNASNTASIANNVNVFALTGDNEVETEDGNGLISTGDAYAAANVLNIVNTNVIGRNWIFAIFNIFGNWGGNISFGRPNLWIGAVAETPNPASPGSLINYHFTIANRGDADATNVMLTGLFDDGLLKFSDDNPGDDGARWSLGNIRRGETIEVTLPAHAATNVPVGDTLVPMTAIVAAHETDDDTSDNSEELAVVIRRSDPTSGGAARGASTGDPRLTVTKSANVNSAELPAKVDYTIVIKNDGGPAYRSLVLDALKNPKGKVIYEQGWDLKTIKEGEEVTITYTTEYNAEMLAGFYTNEVEVRSRARNEVDQYAVDAPIIRASTTVQMLPAAPVVVESAAQCAPYLTSYLRKGGQNDSAEVTKLQTFLWKVEGVEIAISGEFDDATDAAVRAFQEKYKSEVLLPWGHNASTGYVYYTTRRKINELYCDSKLQFPLTDEQQGEVNSFREFLNSLRSRALPLPVNPEIGQAEVEETPTLATVEIEHEVVPPVTEETTQGLRTRARESVANTLEALRGIFNWVNLQSKRLSPDVSQR